MEAGLISERLESPTERRVSYVVWGGLFAVFVVGLLVVAFETAMHFDGVAIDGPFQLYDALRRIEAGFRPGIDFQYFHGLGLPYLYYGVYRLLGDGLRGSELSRELLTAASYPVILLIVFRAFAGSWRRALCLTTIGLAASVALHLAAILFAINGMLGVRAALPTLVPVVLFLAPNRRGRVVLGGVALGVSLFLSTEQGLAVCLAYVVVSLVATLRRAERRMQLAELALTVVVAVATLVICLTVVAGFAGMRGALRYNFKLVPMDQYWYFGAPPNVFIPSWGELGRMLIALRAITEPLLLGVIAAAGYLRRFWREPDGEMGRRHFALAVLPVYGLISCASLLGVFTFAYVQPCCRVLLIVGLLEVSRLAEQSDARASRGGWLGAPRGVTALGMVVVLWSVAATDLIWTAVGVSLPQIVSAQLAGRMHFGMASIWPETLREGQDVIDSHRGTAGQPPTLWSTYSGWIEARNGIFNPSFDYVIHALGPANRQAYVARLRSVRPTLVQTVRPMYTPYEQWIEDNSWPFYDELLQSYAVTALTPWSIYWQRRAAPAPPLRFVAMMNVPKGMTEVQLPPIPDSLAAPTTLIEVDVEYRTKNPLSVLPVVGASPRYLIGIQGAMSRLPISLDPFVQASRFPVLVSRGQRPVLHFVTYSLLPGAGWTPLVLRMWVRPLDAASGPWLADLVSSFTAPKPK